MTDHAVKSSSSKENSDPDTSPDVKVSIIIPVYNVEKYLRQCLDSVVNQTLKGIEIICVNDGSTDNSQFILEEYEEKDPRVRVFTQENMGSGVARNRAIEHVKGEYIGFMDSDDWADPTMFGKLYENAKLNDSDMVMCPMCITNESEEELSSRDIKNLPYYNLECFDDTFDNRVFNHSDTKDFIFKIAVNAYNKIYRTSFVKKFNAKFAEDGLIFQDNIFFYRTYLYASQVSLIRDFLYFHRTSRPGSVQTEKGKKYFDIIEIWNMIMEIFESFPEYEEMELLNKKLIHLVFRYTQVAEIYRPEFYELLKQDFKKMDLNKATIEALQPAARSNYLNILNSNSYKEFELLKERDNLLKRIHELKVQNDQLVKEKNKISGYLSTSGFVKYKTKNIAQRLRDKL